VDVRELAWAAGIFEGEGCIYLRRQSGKGGTGRQAQLKVQMNDEDSVLRFQRVMGMGNVRRLHAPSRAGFGPSWVWDVYGFEKVQAGIALLWFGLGRRRRDKAIEVLTVGRPRAGMYPGYQGRRVPISTDRRAAAAWA
jgi:hypothetical protein